MEKRQLLQIICFIVLATVCATSFAEKTNPWKVYKGVYATVRLDNKDWLDGSKEPIGQLKLTGGFKFKAECEEINFILCRKGIFFAYSAVSLWDIQDKSGPSGDINHNPEVFWELDGWPGFFGKSLDYTQFGYEHVSNGLDNGSTDASGRKNRSRSVHNVNFRSYFRFGDNNQWLFSPKVWWNFVDRENQDIEDFYGYTDLLLAYEAKNKEPDGIGKFFDNLVYTAQLRGNPDTGKGRIDIDISGPIPGLNFRWFAQYFDGYGETLLNYDQYTRSFRIGVMLEDRFRIRGAF